VTALGSILTAMVTPFDAQGHVDEAAAVALMHHLVEHGSDGLVLGGSTGEASTLSDDELARLWQLGIDELDDEVTIVAGTGSNDTRHACELTERATEAGVDATLNVTGYYNRPNRRGIQAHYEEVARATDRPIVLYNIPSRTTIDMDNDLLAELAQLDHVEAVKQANNDSLALIDGLDLYAGNDDMVAATLDLGGAGGICVASHLVGDRMRALVDEPDRRAEIDADLRDVYAVLGVTTNPIPVKAALRMAGHDAGGLRLPLVEASPEEEAEIRGVLERHGLLARTGAST
jgi:4-hydroxy-tetrahydrodipicolinate synthase